MADLPHSRPALLPSPASWPVDGLDNPGLGGAAAVPTLAQQAYEAVKGLIFDFALLPGDRFSETELATRTGVSRTPLRQALQRLQREGFLQVFPKQGWRVAPLDFAVLEDLYDLRVLIETDAVRRLCEATERPVLAELAARWPHPAEGCGAPLQAAPQPDMAAQDEAFHHALVCQAGNREMARVHADITERIRIVRRLDFTQARRIQATCEEHHAILAAITRRRTDEAQRLLRAHIGQSKLEVRHITLDTLYRARQRGTGSPP